ncbi:MAG: protein kinase domain-containing protein [Eubacterium sp.]
MKRRQYLKKSILLCGESDGAVFKRTFVIVKKLSEGASSVCYEAYHENSGRGVLKEFYPKDAYALERTAEGQLIHSQEFQDAYKRFLKAEREYLEPYKMLLDVKRNSENQDLATFIPAFEIYHGCDDNENIIGTTYIWTPEPKLETFKKVCDEIHKHPDYNPEHKLVTVLSAIETLVKCICTMHSAEMIHRDINPSNFGFIKRGNETLTQTLSMFDINSICSVYGKNEDAVVTEGYQEPEVRYEVANNQTDIYSIGATLFSCCHCHG